MIHFQEYNISEIERIALSSCLDRSILSLPGLTTTSIKLAYLIVMMVMMMVMMVQQARLGGNCKILIGPLPLAADASYGWLGPIFLKLGYSHSLSRYSSIFFQLGSSQSASRILFGVFNVIHHIQSCLIFGGGQH